MKESSQPLVTSLLRGLAVLRCFSYGRESLGSSEIARQTGLPQPTVWRICKTLESEGYLVAETDGARYRPGLAVLTLGYAALSTLDIAALSLPLLQQQANQVRGTAGLSTREGLSMLFLQRCEANDAVLNFNMRAGASVSIIHSATGWAHLCMLSEDDRAVLIEELAQEDAALAKASLKPFELARAAYEKTGYLVNSGVFFPGLTSVAVPFRSNKREGIYVVSCSAMSSVFGTKTLHQQAGKALMKIASQLSAV
jgi:DNA-binding IclR family transcriptional regulator